MSDPGLIAWSTSEDGRAAIEAALKHAFGGDDALSIREAEVVTQRLGTEATYAQIAVNYGLSGERVRQIHLRALRKLRWRVRRVAVR